MDTQTAEEAVTEILQTVVDPKIEGSGVVRRAGEIVTQEPEESESGD